MVAKHRALEASQALQLFAREPVAWVAVAREGAPELKACHVAVLDGALVVHGGPRGELRPGLAVANVEQIVARIPSWMIDPERACPATTFYRTATVEGALEAIEEPALKARALQALMEAHQPEGRYVPLSADHPMYAAALRGTGVLLLRPERVVAFEKLGQDRPDALIARIVRGLWGRGGPGDMEAIEAIRRAHASGPSFAEAPAGLVARCAPSEADAQAAAELATGTYWNGPFDTATLRRAVLGSSAWVGLEDARGRLVGTARAVSDRAKRAWVYDVVVAESERGEGLGAALMRMLLDHPAVRDTAIVMLTTRDAQSFYRELGFVEVATDRSGPWPRTHMALDRERVLR